MPVPAFTGAPSWATTEDIRKQLNAIVDELNFFFTNLDSLNIKHLTADVIDAGTLNANLVTIRSDLTNGFIQIDGTGMKVNNGTFDTFTVSIDGNVTMTSALIQSASGFPRVVMDPNSDLFGAYTSATNSIVVGAFNSGSGAPYFEFTNGALNVSMDLTSGIFDIGGNSDARLQFPSGDLELRGRDNFLFATNFTWVPDWNQIKDQNTQNTLQDEFDTFATKGTSTSLSGAHNHGIPHDTVLMVQGGGTVTFKAADTHSHTQQ
jgi:hypothetical protein